MSGELWGDDYPKYKVGWLDRLLLRLGERGWWKHEGLHGYHPGWYPLAYVEYHDTEEFDAKHYGGCRFTCDMPVGNAWGYAKMFKGTVWMKGTGPRDDRATV